jgi:hypothetical protein
VQGVDGQGARFLQALVDEDLAKLALQVGDFDGVRAFVAPKLIKCIISSKFIPLG